MISIRHEIEGWTDYLHWIRNIARSAPATLDYIEVGAWKGQSILALFDCLRAYGKEGNLVAVTPFESNNLVARFEFEQRMAAAGAVVRPEWGTPLEVAAQWPDESADLIFMDAAHKHDSFADELQAWWPKVRPGGIFAGHDYLSPQWVDVAPTVELWAELNGLEVHHEPPHVWWVQKPGGTPWFRHTLWNVDVQIPHEHATNPGVGRDPQTGDLVYIFRTTSWGWGLGRIWVASLDEQTKRFRRKPTMLRLGPEDLNYEDPRVFVYQGRLWASVTISDFRGPLTSRLAIAPLECRNGRWDIAQPLELLSSPNKRRQEKNWTFFESEGRLLSIYGMEPWLIREIDADLTPVVKGASLKWPYGQIRGGSQTFEPYPGKLWTFYHSSIHGKYVVGLLEFDAKTLQPLRMTQSPLFDDEEVKRSWNGSTVLWVAGATIIGDEVLIAYGKDDHSCHLRLEKLADLEDQLLPIGREARPQPALEPAMQT